MPTETSTSDVVARNLRNLSHHFEHSRDDLLQDICLVAKDIICDLFCERQDALQSIENTRRDLVIFVFFLQELDGRALFLLLILQQ